MRKDKQKSDLNQKLRNLQESQVKDRSTRKRCHNGYKEKKIKDKKINTKRAYNRQRHFEDLLEDSEEYGGIL